MTVSKVNPKTAHPELPFLDPVFLHLSNERQQQHSHPIMGGFIIHPLLPKLKVRVSAVLQYRESIFPGDKTIAH